MTTERLTITLEFDNVEEAAYAFMFLDRCGFSEFYARTEPHLGKDVCAERAYRMRNAIAKIERAMERADVPRRVY